MEQTNKPTTILRRNVVEARTGLSRSTIYDKLSKASTRFDPTFPRPIHLGLNAVGWIEFEIETWLQARIQASRED
jgi:prophage regulatory protein